MSSCVRQCIEQACHRCLYSPYCPAVPLQKLALSPPVMGGPPFSTSTINCLQSLARSSIAALLRSWPADRHSRSYQRSTANLNICLDIERSGFAPGRPNSNLPPESIRFRYTEEGARQAAALARCPVHGRVRFLSYSSYSSIKPFLVWIFFRFLIKTEIKTEAHFKQSIFRWKQIKYLRYRLDLCCFYPAKTCLRVRLRDRFGPGFMGIIGYLCNRGILSSIQPTLYAVLS